MGLFSRDKPKIKIQTTKRDGFSGWLKCTHCSELIHSNELADNQNCCPKCFYHYRVPTDRRIASLADGESFQELFSDLEPVDALNFVDSETYPERLARAGGGAGQTEAVAVGTCTIGHQPAALAVMNFAYMAGSMGSVVGERVTRLIEVACEQNLPLIIVSSSGGARMQESVLSLMQMAKTSAALAKLSEKGLPFISVLTNPTTGGVTASFASLGDIIIAEPQALICFAGPRVIEQTIGEKLPEGAQKAEFLLQHGMIDCIVPRSELKETIVSAIGYLTGNDREYEPSLLKEEVDSTRKLPKKLQELLNFSENQKKGKK